MKKNVKNNKLVMTLLVRDESDIIENNICFHLNSGVDYIIATDNGSIDGTRDILEKYQKKGVLFLIDEPKHTYEQDKWVSNMAKIAIDKYNADYLIHCDADEFWYEKNGKLKEVIKDIDDLAYVNVINYLPPYINGGKNLNFNNFKFIIEQGEVCPVRYEDRNPNKYLFYGQNHPKVITSNKYREIAYGNHNVKSSSNFEKKYVNEIFIHHFPIRSLTHFKTKVINGGSSYEKNPLKDRDIGWHWRKWYEIYKQGKIEDAYKELCLFGDLNDYIKSGKIKETIVPRKIKYNKEIFCINNLFKLS